ncbi:hypothetical protein CIPAW_02G068000 [Carya illinoinensis]|uniref:Uncharacterized protein n=1 Tax=Carya illinoinensis TaxID=32201 RepID=A0A8T1RB52_CARIL|nr:hypothetical protein CIPAW_02G068000 [Carya illinoinensis]
MRHDESMAWSSSLDSSNLNSTSGLLSLLDLNLQQDQDYYFLCRKVTHPFLLSQYT